MSEAEAATLTHVKQLEDQYKATINTNGAAEKHIPTVTITSNDDSDSSKKVEVQIPHGTFLCWRFF